MFLQALMETFSKWRGPDGEFFAETLNAELKMGKLADALKAEQAAQGTFKTPNGYVPDAEDAVAIDALIAKHFSDFKPPAQVPIPKAGQP